MTRSLTRLGLPIAALLAVALALPAAAAADDRSFAETSISEAQKLGKTEKAASKAVSKVRTHSKKAITTARRKIAGVRKQATRMTTAVRREDTSTDAGATAKSSLLKLLKTERGAYALLDDALAQLRKGNVSTANRLAKRANDKLKAVGDEARKLGQTLAQLAAAG
jgi:erythromycin esterase-like protein